MEFVRSLGVETLLGEGLHWCHARQFLWWVDIHGQRLLAWDGQSATWNEWATPQRIGWVIPCQRSTDLLAGFQQGIALIQAPVPGQPLSIEKWLVKPFDHQSSLRLNDAKADASGGVWAGSLNNDNESRPDGCLFRLAPDGSWHVHDAGYLVANGPAIHPDGRWMLHTDSSRRTIYAFDVDRDGASLHHKRIWRVFADDEGYPDGMTFDADGAVWVAHWGAGCVSRFDQDGRLMRRIRLPVSNITNVCFGGVDWRRLFVSSARVGLTADILARQPLAGALFEIDALGVRGLPGGTWSGA